jgi:FtsH-binding integral membrane protein
MAEPASPADVLWYQSTLLWGCLGVVVALVLAALTAPVAVRGPLLVLAWFFAILVVWEFARTRKSSKVRLRIGGAVASGVCLVPLWIYVSASDSAEDLRVSFRFAETAGIA